MAFGIFLVYHIGFVDEAIHLPGALDSAMNRLACRDRDDSLPMSAFVSHLRYYGRFHTFAPTTGQSCIPDSAANVSSFAKSVCSRGNVNGVRGLARLAATTVNSRAISIHGDVNEFLQRGISMKKLKSIVTLAVSLCMLAPSSLFASSHREAPITALDRSADVTDWYAFVSYDNPKNVTFILNVDPLLEPANGPNYFPFDPNVVYQMLVDNDQDGIPEVIFQFRFSTQIRDPKLFTGFVGGIAGIPPITSLQSSTGSEGLSLVQTYTVTMIKNGKATVLNSGQTLYAVPSNVGPLTMPNYQSLFDQGINRLGDGITQYGREPADDPLLYRLGGFFLTR